MTGENRGLTLVARALKELPDEERMLYRARYFADEEPAKTCTRLGITSERYEELLRAMMRSLRGMTSGVTRSSNGQVLRGST